MGIVVSGVVETERMLLNFDSNTKRRALGAIIKGAKEIQELAIKMAPVDDGNLEKAIKIAGAEEGALRDESGRFARREVVVYVDTEMPVPERAGKTVGDYAYEMHEHLTPKGPLKLGEKSEAKQASQPEEVGGGYLERALAAKSDEIFSDVAVAVNS